MVQNTVVKAHYRGEGTSPEHYIYSKCKWMDQSKGVDYSAGLVLFMYCRCEIPMVLAGDSRICLSQLTTG